ncbi:MAG TPA: quinohemoprotein amine dehydrogenase subunit alpha [Geminicoccaceae bacterium]|nr:quinohemoprotein amine dehydrogenase subunit alpha [Geminicoccaceae bacterium]
MAGRWLLLASFPVALTGLSDAALAQSDGEALLNARCSACHQRTADGGLARISDQRKTPEAWDMTIVRMMQLHGVELTGDERAALVKHLADTQGLAPAETAGFRYILERVPSMFEEPPTEDLGTMCARCHSWARVALQRRPEEEWRKLAHFHLGQYPTTEYQALGRDRKWWEIASEQLPPELAERFPLETPEWKAWQEREPADLSGEWRFVGRDPAAGDYEGVATIESTGDDTYSVTLELTYADGQQVEGEGSGIVYTGFEWRSRVTIGDDETLQVFAVSEDGKTMTGRSFRADADSIGRRVTNVRMDDGTSALLAASPPYLRAGESAEIAIHGFGLEGDVSLGEGVTVEEVLSRDGETVVVRASADADAANGPRTVSVGETDADGLLTVYQSIDFVTVEPSYNIARVGGGGGPLPPVPAQFEAIAWLNGPDGEAGTDDDIAIGAMPASWSVENFDEVAEEMADTEFAGEMQPNGVFLPAEAGPNPKRPFQTNNAGNLKVIATVQDDGRAVTGEGQLLVTVQRWNDPPIR